MLHILKYAMSSMLQLAPSYLSMYFKSVQGWRDFKDKLKKACDPIWSFYSSSVSVSSHATAWCIFRVSGSVWASIVFTQIWHWHHWCRNYSEYSSHDFSFNGLERSCFWKCLLEKSLWNKPTTIFSNINAGNVSQCFSHRYR